MFGFNRNGCCKVEGFQRCSLRKGRQFINSNMDEISQAELSFIDQSSSSAAKFFLTSAEIKAIIKNNDILRLQSAIDNKQIIEINRYGNKSTLDLAVELGCFEITKCLLDNKADINIYKHIPGHRSPLIPACYHGSSEIISLLIERGLYIDDTVLYESLSTLHSFFSSDKNITDKVLPLLVGRIQDVNYVGRRGDTYLNAACEINNVALVRLLLTRGANRDAPNHYGTDAFRVAAGHGYTDIVRLLLSWDKSRPVSQEVVSEALISAARTGKLEVVRILTECGIETTTMVAAVEAAIYSASYSYEVIEYFILNYGTDIFNTRAGRLMWENFFICFTLYTAAAYRDDRKRAVEEREKTLKLPVARLFLRHTIDLDAYYVACTDMILLYTCRALDESDLHISYATVLLEYGADLNFRHSETGQTPLMSAALNSSVGLVRLCLEHGSDVTCTDNNGRTVLDLLGRDPTYAAVRELCERYNGVYTPVLK